MRVHTHTCTHISCNSQYLMRKRENELLHRLLGRFLVYDDVGVNGKEQELPHELIC